MFKNPGAKLKSIAITSFIVDCISAVIGGIVLLSNDYGWAGFITLIGGLFVSYVIALLIYGFGELVENSGKPFAHEDSEGLETTVSNPIKTVAGKTDACAEITCPRCGASQFNNRKTCFKCGAKFE